MKLPFVKYCLAILMAASVLTACDVGGQGETSSKRSSVYDDAKLTTDRGFYVHIKADFEVVKTGEAINFDYVISCYNREVPGSFHGVLKPKIMFKATSTGEAMAIVPPEHYCERGLRGKPLEQARDQMVIPQVTWYPDVNDLSFAITYMNDDAYKNPNAHVRFKSYSFAKSTRENFLAFKTRAETEYEQIGAIPGPFGCADESVQYRDEYACGTVERLSRNGGHFIMFADERFTDNHVRVYSVPDKLITAIRRLPHGKSRYYCGGGRSDIEGEDFIPRLQDFRTRKRNEFNEEEKQLLIDLFGRFHNPRNSRFLSWDAVEDSSSDIIPRKPRVGTLYPFVQHGKQYHFNLPKGLANNIEPKEFYSYFIKPENLRYDTIQILHDERWRGFGIEQSQDILVHMPEVAIDFEEPKDVNGRAIFINGEPTCIGGLSDVIYDLEKKLIFKIQR